MRADLQVIGFAQTLPRRVAASATRIEVGEPLVQASVTWSSGAASANVFTLAALDCVVIGTDVFGGIAAKGSLPFETGTLVAQTMQSANPIPTLGRIEGKAEVKASVDTAAELLAIINDFTLIDYNATGASDGGQLYTIKETAAADTSAFTIVEGNVALGTLQVTVDSRAYRFDVS